MQKYTKSQLEAIQFNTGPAMVLAGPGSGKTTVITQRIHNLICKHHVPPEHILVVTFTKAAAVNMRLRFKSLMSGRTLPVVFGTFHSVFYKMLRMEQGDNKFQVITESRRISILKEICIRLRVDIRGQKDFVAELSSEIGKVRGNDKSVDDYIIRSCNKEVFKKILAEYHQAKKAENLIDFEDMLVLCLRMLEENKTILKKWQGIFQYVLIDEFQDINSIQYRIIRMLAEPSNNIFIVGDDDQSIYGFRGARPDIMLGFCDHYPEAKVIYLSENFRSTDSIVKCANNVIKNNRNRYTKNNKANCEGGPEVDIRGFDGQGQQIDYVCNLIKKYFGEGVEATDIAILVRNNDIIPLIQKSFIRKGICAGGKEKRDEIYLSDAATDIMNFFKAAISWNKVAIRDNNSFLEIMNKPDKNLSAKVIIDHGDCVENLVRVYSHSPEMINNIEDINFHMTMLGRLEPFAAINYIRNAIGYNNYVKKEKYNNTQGLNKELDILDRLQGLSSTIRSLEEWVEYALSQREVPVARKDERDSVAVITMHASKGLEFQVVIILNANQGIIPGSKACRERDYEEERRVFYVALTRAKKYLHVCFIGQNLGFEMEESMYINEMLD